MKFLLYMVFGILSICTSAYGQYYKDKTIQIVVGYGAGGGYDLYARTVSEHLGRHIAGNPKIVVRNMPGAGSLVAINNLYNTLPQDGTVLGTFSSALTNFQLFDDPNVHYDSRKLKWLGSFANSVSVCFFAKSKQITTFDQLRSTKLVVGSTGNVSNSSIYPKLINQLFNSSLNVIVGYETAIEIIVAMERREVDGMCGWTLDSLIAARKQWITNNDDVTIPVQIGIARSKHLPNVPSIIEFAISERDKQSLIVAFNNDQWHKPFAVGPNVDDQLYQIINNAFIKLSTDNMFLDQAEKRNLNIEYVSGQQITQMINELFTVDKHIIEQTKRATQ